MRTNLIWLLVFLVVLAAIDENFLAWAYLQASRAGLFFRKVPLLIRMEWDLFWMKRNMNKYLEMAKEIRKELGVEDEAE